MNKRARLLFVLVFVAGCDEWRWTPEQERQKQRDWAVFQKYIEERKATVVPCVERGGVPITKKIENPGMDAPFWKYKWRVPFDARELARCDLPGQSQPIDMSPEKK